MADNPENFVPPDAEELLRRANWAKALSDEDYARARSGITLRRITAGGFVCRKGEPVEHWFGVLNGLVKLSSDWVTGKTATLTGVPAGGWFGEGSIMKTEPRRFDAVALRDSCVAFMRRETFHWLLDNSISFNRFLLAQLNERLGQFIGLLESERLLDTDTRVARCLTALYNPVLYPGLASKLAISQEEIGYLAGVSRQRVNKSLRILEDAGFIAVEYGGLEILDLDGLRRFGGQ